MKNEMLISLYHWKLNNDRKIGQNFQNSIFKIIQKDELYKIISIQVPIWELRLFCYIFVGNWGPNQMEYWEHNVDVVSKL